MKKLFVALALFMFVGSGPVAYYAFAADVTTELVETGDKDKDKKKKKKCDKESCEKKDACCQKGEKSSADGAKASATSETSETAAKKTCEKSCSKTCTKSKEKAL